MSAIERESFTQPWPAQAYRKEIQQNRMAYYFVVKRLDGPALEPAELGLTETASAEPSLVGRFTRLFKPQAATLMQRLATTLKDDVATFNAVATKARLQPVVVK